MRQSPIKGYATHVDGDVAHAVAAIGEEGDLLVHLEPLIAQHLVQAALGFPVEALQEAEIPVAAILGHGLADHDLEMCLPALAVRLAGADVAAIDTDDDRALGQG